MMSFSTKAKLGVGVASPEFFLRFSLRRLDDGVLVFDSDTGQTSLLPLDRSLAFDFFQERIAEDGEIKYDLQELITGVGLFDNC